VRAVTAQEPPAPQRGLTAEERGSDASDAEQAAASAPSMPQRMKARASLRFLLSQADGYPVGVKQFLQFCLVIVWPAWLFALLVGWVFYGVAWLLFLPLRMWMKRNRPDDYAASQLK
jgi:hypothetical protein